MSIAWYSSSGCFGRVLRLLRGTELGSEGKVEDLSRTPSTAANGWLMDDGWAPVGKGTAARWGLASAQRTGFPPSFNCAYLLLDSNSNHIAANASAG